MKQAQTVADKAIKTLNYKRSLLDNFEILYKSAEELLTIYETQKAAQNVLNLVDSRNNTSDKFEILYAFVDSVSESKTL